MRSSAKPRWGWMVSASLDNELEALRKRLRWAQESQDLAVRILALLNRQVVGLDAIQEILGMVKEFTGFDAVGIRLRDGEDFPYFETRGFPAHFVEAENSLCVALTVVRSSAIRLEIQSWIACAET